MATVYKIEVEVTSHWISYDKETMAKIVKEKLEELDEDASYKGNEITIDEIDIKKIA